jgi:carboxymethylenebutenolidase
MTSTIKTFTTSDGKSIQAFVAAPQERPRGAILVVQEIFGLTEHIQWVATEQWAKAGFLAIAPALFDRVTSAGHGVLPYDQAGTAQGRQWVDELGMDWPLRDLRSAQEQLAIDAHGNTIQTGVVGYCWGGSVAFLTATRLGLPGVSYYGGRTTNFLHEQPQAPVMLHFGQTDALISAAAVDQTRRVLTQRAPSAQIFEYPAGHGFNRFGHPDFHEPSAQLALQRSIGFFNQTLR